MSRQQEPPLTEEQLAVVRQPSDALVLVTAAAGAGKTHTLVRRVEHLVGEEGLGSGEILVLTFSRAAVRELRHRLARYGDRAGRVRAQTFDSWALDLLMEVRGSEEWQTYSFDERIRAAAHEIAAGNLDDRYVDDLKHVIIDEVQDLVGDRRELVETLLERYDCGFTVVGDVAQAIYGFQVQDPLERSGETDRFADWLRVSFDDELVELLLTDNFRARTQDARSALPLGEELRRTTRPDTGEGARLYEELRTVLRGADVLGALDDSLVSSGLRHYDGTIAFLCRTNGQALRVSEDLYNAGVGHRLQRTAQDRVVPAWVVDLFHGSEGSRLPREQALAIISRRNGEEGDLAEPEDVIRTLMRTAGDRRGDALDLDRLKDAMAQGRLPDELTASPRPRILVSSFHRAKGLEFDRVVVVDPGPLPEPTDPRTRDSEALDEARMLYVAMTRSHEELWRHELPRARPIGLDKTVGRWARYGRQRWERHGMEITGQDVDHDHPAGTRLFEADPAALQTYLAQEVTSGDEVLLTRLWTQNPIDGHSPPYLIEHAGRPIGVTSTHFARTLYRHLTVNRGHTPHNHPAHIRGVHIDTVETVTGSTASGELAGLGRHGVWLAPRLFGLGRFHWEKKTDTEDEHA